MSHVISSQPSSTSPYQPTEIQESLNGHHGHQRKSTIETRQDRDDCCFRADKSQGCFLYYCCNFLSSVCGGIRDCTEKCCNCCADCLADCCEDKPEDRNRNKRKRYGSSQEYDYDDNTWVVGAIQHHNTASDNQPDIPTMTLDSSVHYFRSHDSGHDNKSHCHDSRTTELHTPHSSCHDSGIHHSSGGHDSGHHSSGHDSGHHSSGHDSGGHHTSSHDTGGDTCDYGGDSGGGCDSGGGGDVD